MLPEPFWIELDEVIAIYDMQLREHGGPSGLRDHGLLEGALSWSLNMNVYSDPDLADLAACCAFGLVRNHPFLDGNKRTSLALCLVFLDLNGFDLPVAKSNTATWLALAAGQISESELAVWLRHRMVSAA